MTHHPSSAPFSSQVTSITANTGSSTLQVTALACGVMRESLHEYDDVCDIALLSLYNLCMRVVNPAAHLVSLVAVCCRDSYLSWSDCSGRMFFSSSSLFDGRLLSLMARESFRKTFMASVPSMIRQEAKWTLCINAQLCRADPGCNEHSLHNLTVRSLYRFSSST